MNTTDPKHYRNLLSAVRRAEASASSLDAVQLLRGHGFGSIEELQARADAEEQAAKPPKLSAAERALALVQSQLEQAEGAVESERQRFRGIERLRSAICEAESLRARLPSALALKAERARILDQITDQFVENLKSGEDPYAAARMNAFMGQLASIDVTLEILKPAAALIDARVTEAEGELSALEADAAEVRATVAATAA
jgi:hypothetical protein